MIAQHEMTALLALIQRLEETPPLTPIQRYWKEREVKMVQRTIGDSDSTWWARRERTKRKTIFQPRDKNHPVFGDTKYALGFQVRQLEANLDDWFSWAHFVAPAFRDQIPIILKRAKEPELRQRFLDAYDRHFADYWGGAPPAPDHDDVRCSILQREVPALDVKVASITHDEGTKYSIAYELCCRACGGFVISTPDDNDDNGPALCKACGLVFGSFGDLKAFANRVGELELIKRGLTG